MDSKAWNLQLRHLNRKSFGVRLCALCGENYTNLLYCNGCQFQEFYKIYGSSEHAKIQAHARNMTFYPADCPHHGPAVHHVYEGCKLCSSPPYRVARALGQVTYLAECRRHGWSLHSAMDARCVECRAGNGSRVNARFAGEREYVWTCAVHGETAFSVKLAKCLKCFNAMGQPRLRETGGRPPLNEARAQARREGKRRYLGDCEHHGRVSFSTGHGKCLKCYNSGGFLRPAPRAPWETAEP